MGPRDQTNKIFHRSCKIAEKDRKSLGQRTEKPLKKHRFYCKSVISGEGRKAGGKKRNGTLRTRERFEARFAKSKQTDLKRVTQDKRSRKSGGRRRLKSERRMTKNKTTKWTAGRLGPRDQTNKISQRSCKIVEKD